MTLFACPLSIVASQVPKGIRIVLRKLVLLSACALFSTALSAQGSEDLELNIIADVVYGRDYGMAMTFDVYVPSNPNGAGVILINSGGWQSPFDTFKIQTDETFRYATNEEMFESNSWHVLSPKLLVTSGYTVFEVRHGSEPKFEMREIVLHVRRAVRFIWHHASEYGVDSARIGLWGGSASGHLSLLVGTSPELELEESSHEWEKHPATVSAIVAFAPPTDLARLVADNPAELEEQPVLRLEKDQYREFSPVTYATPGDPPTLIMHGNADDSVPIVQGELMFEALQNAGVESEFMEFDETTHSPTLEQAERGVIAALKWFEKYLLP